MRRVSAPLVPAKDGLFIEGEVRSLKLRFLVDTGTTDTIISAEAYYTIPLERRPKLEDQGVRVLQADGKPLETLGVALVDVCVGRTTYTVRVVFAKVSVQGILGMDFLLPTRGKLDFGRRELVLNGEHVKCTSRSGAPLCARVVVSQTTVIPAGHETLVPGRMSTPLEAASAGIVEPVQGGGDLAKKGLILGRTLVNPTEDTVALRILNPGRQKCVLRCGSAAGHVTTVDEEDIDESPQVPHVDARQGTAKEANVPSHLQDLWKRAVEDLDPLHHGAITELLVDYADVFSKGDGDLGRTDLVKHGINTGSARPIRERLRRQPACNQREIDRHVSDLLARNIIQHSDQILLNNYQKMETLNDNIYPF